MPSVRRLSVLRAVDCALARRPRSVRDERMRQEALDLVRREALVDAAYSYRIVPLEGAVREPLCAGGETLRAPRLVPASGELTALACGVATIGATLETRVSALFAERSVSLALALDALGNELLVEVSRRAQDRMLADTRGRGLTMAGELRAGDPGLDLGAQPSVLRLAQAETSGVTLSRGAMMRPVKSTSMVLGVGLALAPARWSRCDHCPSRGRCAVAP